MSKLFTKETELVAAFVDVLSKPRWSVGKAVGDGWTAYHETAGWDVLLSNDATALQVGIEAKLSLNAKVLSQALPSRSGGNVGPDYRAVLVPSDGCQHHMVEIAGALGISVIVIRDDRYERDTAPRWQCDISLPEQGGQSWSDSGWFPWLPISRENLPDYIPDVRGGDSAPVCLTPWKVKAIKLLILLERRGAVHRSDMKALDISATRWTESHHGFLAPSPDGYVRCDATPDLKSQHPVNWAQIEADFEEWNPYAKRETTA